MQIRCNCSNDGKKMSEVMPKREKIGKKTFVFFPYFCFVIIFMTFHYSYFYISLHNKTYIFCMFEGG